MNPFKVDPDIEVRSGLLANSKIIYEYMHESARNLLQSYDDSRARRGSDRRAPPSYQEVDLLRAMLVLTSAGLDALLKHVIKDCLLELAHRDQSVRSELHKFTVRHIEGKGKKTSAEFLASILVSAQQPRKELISQYIVYITGDSLQNAQQVAKASKALGVDYKKLPQNLKEIFDVRNKIIHELDLDLSKAGPGKRKRNSRKVEDMKAYAERLLEVAVIIVKEVDSKLQKSVPMTSELQKLDVD